MSKKGHIPIRTCVGCRKKREKTEMIRLTQCAEGGVRVNEKKFHLGRGFYLCPDIGCLNMAKKKKRGVGFLEIVDFRNFSAEGLLKSEKVGIGEERNDEK
jgi:predicted RNA-binding protein YlxR (DUF448 family)